HGRTPRSAPIRLCHTFQRQQTRHYVTYRPLKQRWRTLQHVTLSPSRIGDIARAALVLNGIWK
ncbi:hypothetical protein, partial [Streptomyces sp. T028]|uniref:hypothetical protein n=1 Tax=Streptomyces sp. T028 TaxID=3394379 RepID=UPI003A89FCC6